jgi:hypothetical protein
MTTSKFKPSNVEERGIVAHTALYRYYSNSLGKRVTTTQVAIKSKRKNSWDLFQSKWSSGSSGFPKIMDGDYKYKSDFADGTIIKVNIIEKHETLFLSSGKARPDEEQQIPFEVDLPDFLIAKIGRTYTDTKYTYSLFTKDYNILSDHRVKERLKRMIDEFTSRDTDYNLDDDNVITDMVEEELEEVLEESMLVTESETIFLTEDVLKLRTDEELMDEIDDIEFGDFSDQYTEFSFVEDDTLSLRSESLFSEDNNALRKFRSEFIENIVRPSKMKNYRREQYNKQFYIPKFLGKLEYRYAWTLELPFKMTNSDKVVGGIKNKSNNSRTIYGVLPSGNEGTERHDSSSLNELLNLIDNLDEDRKFWTKHMLCLNILESRSFLNLLN